MASKPDDAKHCMRVNELCVRLKTDSHSADKGRQSMLCSNSIQCDCSIQTCVKSRRQQWMKKYSSQKARFYESVRPGHAINGDKTFVTNNRETLKTRDVQYCMPPLPHEYCLLPALFYSAVTWHFLTSKSESFISVQQCVGAVISIHKAVSKDSKSSSKFAIN